MARFSALAALNVDDAITDAWVDEVKAAHDYLAIAGADLASAATINITSEFHAITGVATINNINDANGAVKGQKVRLWKSDAGSLIITHGGGGGNIRLAAKRDLGVYVEDYVDFTYTGALWEQTLPHTPFCQVRSNGTSVANTTFVDLALDVEDLDSTQGMHDVVTNNNRVVIPVAGIYFAIGSAISSAAAPAGYSITRLKKNGASLNSGGGFGNAPGNANTGASRGIVFAFQAMAVNDYFGLDTFQDSGGTVTVSGFLTVWRVA